MSRKALAGISLAALLVAGLPAAGNAAGKHTVKNDTIKGAGGTTIAITVFRPATATTKDVPVVLHSHGWGGSRETEIAGDVEALLDAGFGVVSVDQRGHGESQGQANVQDPKLETEDIKNVIDYIAALDWVLHDKDAGGRDVTNDPVLGAIGGSYGGGYQTMTALDEIADDGRTRFNALAPQITWYDLPESLAPQKVTRSTWVSLLYAAGASMVPQFIHESFVWGATTGQWPDGTLYDQPAPGVPNLDKIFHKHSPVSFVEKGIRIDVPVLIRQGTTDNLFNMNQGLKIFDQAVTDSAREQSYFVAYNGGHALPNAAPPGSNTAAELGGGVDACSGDFTKLTIAFFKKVFAGQSTKGLMPARYNLTTMDGDKCLHVDDLDKVTAVTKVDPAGAGSVVSTVGVGAPVHLPLKGGTPKTVAGVPVLSGKVSAIGLDSRAFFGLSVGRTPADARVIQNNLMPLRVVMPGADKKFRIELPGVVAPVPDGQSLFLTITPLSDMYTSHGSRSPGGLVLSGLKLTLPRPAR